MDTRDLLVFQTVAELESISRAAEQLNYVQSNVTARIQKLEAELQTPLFYRHHRGLHLNPEGKRLLEYTNQILALVSEMKKSVQNPDVPSGKLDLGSVETVISLPTILSTYNKKYPNVDLSLVTGVSAELIQKVLTYKLDGAFVVQSEPHPELTQHPVIREELVFITQEQGSALELHNDGPFLVFNIGCGYRAKLEQWLQSEGITKTKMMEFGTLETILGSVVSGLGSSIVPISAAAHLERKKLIKCHKVPEEFREISIVFVQRANKNKTATMNTFIDTIDECRTMQATRLPLLY